MTGSEIRETFISYFEERGHKRVASSPLVPARDPTLLFTNAGMAQFKNVFLGVENPPAKRAVSSQKCMRAGGKHNDLENVGYTARHHTFFEMLGNFSFGDYFKEDAVRFGWDLITNVFKLPRDRIWVTVHKGDDEAFEIWEKESGLPRSRIVRMGDESNFWSMGDEGPCGPCSEILIDQGEKAGCGGKECAVGCECDRYLELWNLVFMQYERDGAGVMSPLPRPSIDTGMGLERMAAVIQGAPSNYETDLLRGIIARVEEVSGKKYRNGSGGAVDSSMRVVADHARAVAFLVSDGVFPSNEGRGYVLRRIIRRAVRHAKTLGARGPFLFKTLEAVAAIMGGTYPELAEKAEFTSQIVMSEEERFLETVDRGLEILENEVGKLSRGEKLSGRVAFKLYDTYGFPLDLTEDVLRGRNVAVDREGFAKEMERQKKRSRKSWKGSAAPGEGAADYSALLSSGFLTDFVGYETTEGSGKVVLVDGGAGGGDLGIVTDSTPFFAESGGQTGDAGTIEGDGFVANVVDTVRPAPGITSHRAVVVKGKVSPGDSVRLSVDGKRRRAACAHHTATHILHAVLREKLGTHVSQAGSLVAPNRLRFDFTHHSPVSAGEIEEIEGAVNERIGRADEVVTKADVPYEEALKGGATAIFEEKYGDRVRVVSIGDYSVELCGGTHLGNSAAAGMFKIVSQSASSAGVRRIEAVCSEAARARAAENEKALLRIAHVLGVGTSGVFERVESLLKRNGELERESAERRKDVLSGDADAMLSEAREINGVRFVSREFAGAGPAELREIWDGVRPKIESGVAALGGTREGKAFILVGVAGDVPGGLHAGNIVRELAPLIGGRGGGRPALAQAGGDAPECVGKAIEKAAEMLESL